MKVKITYLLISLLVMSVGPSNADLYTWTGEDGVLYFSDKPGHPDAELYIKEEPEPIDSPIQSVPTPIEAIDETRDKDALANELEAANAQLNEAFDRIEKLSAQVEAAESKAEAAAAASVAAQEAAAYADHAAESAANSNGRNSIVYYGVPYPYKRSHKQRIVKKHYRGVHPKDFKKKSRYGLGNRSAGHKVKHHFKNRRHQERYSRHDVLKPKGHIQNRQRRTYDQRRSNHIVDGKIKKSYRRSLPANSIGQAQRKIGRNSLDTSLGRRQGRYKLSQNKCKCSWQGAKR